MNNPFENLPEMPQFETAEPRRRGRPAKPALPKPDKPIEPPVPRNVMTIESSDLDTMVAVTKLLNAVAPPQRARILAALRKLYPDG